MVECVTDLMIRGTRGIELGHWLAPATMFSFACAAAGVVAVAGALPVALAVLLAGAGFAAWNSPLRTWGHVPLSAARPRDGGDSVVVLWRPGCPYSARLRRALRREGLSVHWVNIWRDPQADALCRSVNHGTEQTPTVMLVDGSSRRPVVLSATATGIREALAA